MRSDVRTAHRERVARGARLAAHIAVVGTASVLMIAGIGLCMSIVLMPFGLVVGLTGMLLLSWGVSEA